MDSRSAGGNEGGFPADDYTPHGYLDNPHHSWRLGRSGVLRTVPALGMGWYFPNFPGPYGRRWIYSLTVRPAFSFGSSRLLTADDVAGARLRVRSPYHSKNLLRLELETSAAGLAVEYVLVERDELGIRLELTGREVGRARFWLLVEYTRQLGISGDWDFGLLARHEPGAAVAVLSAYAEGTAFALGLGLTPVWSGCFAQADEAARAIARRAEGQELDGVALKTIGAPRGEKTQVLVALEYQYNLSAGGRVVLDGGLGRGESVARARSAGVSALAGVAVARRDAITADRQFWQHAPRPVGDWPPHWRRGWVYDLETLRAIVRPAKGIYRSRWDGMQIQVPRVVLAETMLDMLLLSIADPATAKQVMLGTLLDSPAANVPCTREDGSVNMVAFDGSACGTAPSWCYPFYCVGLVFERTGDIGWLRQMFKPLAAYLEWWLAERVGPDGWPHYKSGWESGQDETVRFGNDQEGGGLTQRIRAVDLVAAMSLSARLLARWAPLVGRADDVGRWQAVADEYRERTQSMWRDGWFHDFDGEQATTIRDPMQFAPIICGIATSAQLDALARPLSSPPAHGAWTPLEWPPVAFTVLESAALAGQRELAARLAYGLLERIWSTEDTRQPTPGGPLPGIAAEHWPPTGDWGTEGYGWGAMAALFLTRQVMGLRESADRTGLTVAPMLPEQLQRVPARFGLENYGYRGVRLDLILEVLADRSVRASLKWRGLGDVLVVEQATRRVLASGRGSGQVEFDAATTLMVSVG